MIFKSTSDKFYSTPRGNTMVLQLTLPPDKADAVWKIEPKYIYGMTRTNHQDGSITIYIRCMKGYEQVVKEKIVEVLI